MTGSEVVLRRWVGMIRTEHEQQYVEYISYTGAADYAATPGNRGSQMLLRPLANGLTEVTTLSWWDSLDSIKHFAGENIDLARYYPEDDRFLVERPCHVEHHRVVISRATGCLDDQPQPHSRADHQ